MFSKELINKTIKYFAENFQHVITEDVAELYLNSMAGFFESFVKLKNTSEFDKIKKP